jgi:ABC-type sugar transport system permease subunit
MAAETASIQPVATTGGASVVGSHQTSRATIAAFLAPALIIFAAFTLYPVLRTFYNSVHVIGPHNIATYVGTKNFSEILTHDPVFWRAVGNTVAFTIVGTIADVLGGLLLALCLFARPPFARSLRIIWFTPVLMSYVVVGSSGSGSTTMLGVHQCRLHWLGLGFLEQSGGDPSTALLGRPRHPSLEVAGLQHDHLPGGALPLPRGAGSELDSRLVRQLVYIIIPMLRPTLVNLLVLSFIGKMMMFDLVWIMTNGGPLWSTETVSTYVYKRAFDWNTFDLGYPAPCHLGRS